MLMHEPINFENTNGSNLLLKMEQRYDRYASYRRWSIRS
jgi:hypothetical protein